MTETPNNPVEQPSEGMSVGKVVRIVVVALVSLGVLAGIGGFAYDKLTSADRDKTGAITSQGKVDVTDLKAGDCVVENLVEGEFTRVEVAPCAKAHFFEAYATFKLPAGDFPGDEKVDQLAGDGCYERFEDFVGVSYDDSELEMTYMSPIGDTWSMDRGVACLVTEEAATKGSLKAANR
ncbi:septum formation family protein [Aeromicrobium sp.]|uniref:septum formation family protein n=1 Tax=Aeromicrobium sp. TaxID=1871063 RepID=UPI002FCB1BE7